ncbi:M28 family peptidase [Candidatus Thorarchaeota archaeon]|nr:MAG: M28 family peptidase [Candidatus Thorarchaeota archaeon]
MSAMRQIAFLVALLILSLTVTPSSIHAVAPQTLLFDGNNAMDYLVQQCSFGPRPPGSENLSQCRTYLVDILEMHGWNVTLQSFTYKETECVNIIANWGLDAQPTFVLGAHYDTRPAADRDPAPENRSKAILGANDGASGVAVVLELAQVLPVSARPSIELVLFDAEDSGNLNGWDWIVGSNYYVDQLSSEERFRLNAMILVDLVGDADLRLEREVTSTDSLQDAIWSIAAELGHDDNFLNVTGSSVLDDHTPFLQAQIPALDIIQHSPFPWYWHTLEDTPDKCSAESLEVVGQVLEQFFSNSSDETYTTDPLTLDPLLLGLVLIPILMVLGAILYRKR